MNLLPALCLILASPGFTAALKPAKGPISGAQFKVSFKMSLKEIEKTGNFVLQDGSQASYVEGGDVAYDSEKGAEFKKRATIVNCVATKNPATQRLRAECQFELSGSVKSKTSKYLETATFQLQTSFEAEKGQTVILVDEAEKRLEVKIEELK